MVKVKPIRLVSLTVSRSHQFRTIVFSKKMEFLTLRQLK